VGLTGGIGSGKSTVARRLVGLGAVLVDSDVLAREVVAPGTDGIAEIVDTFGAAVLGPDGALDRPALASVVFADRQARERLNAIVHPRVRERTEALVAAAAREAIVVQDVPLLVETGSPAAFALVVVVHADAGERERRLGETRGMSAADARARIAAQADDDARRAAADVWLDNSGTADDLTAAVDALWRDRLVPFEANLRTRRPVVPAPGHPVDPDPGWAAAGARLAARVARAAGGGCGVAHIGPTAVPGLPADDVLDVQLAVDTVPAIEAVRAALDASGFPRVDDASGFPRVDDAAGFPRLDDAVGEEGHAGADPGRPVRVHLRPARSPAWRAALLRRDWLRSDAAARAQWADLTRGSADARHSWDRSAVTRAEDWAASSGWTPSLSG
jgi:dephospho-CoA kinase